MREINGHYQWTRGTRSWDVLYFRVVSMCGMDVLGSRRRKEKRGKCRPTFICFVFLLSFLLSFIGTVLLLFFVALLGSSWIGLVRWCSTSFQRSNAWYPYHSTVFNSFCTFLTMDTKQWHEDEVRIECGTVLCMFCVRPNLSGHGRAISGDSRNCGPREQ